VAPTLHVEVVTPEAPLWSGEASAFIARSSEGEFTILALHTPMVGDLVPGVVRVVTEDAEFAYLLHGGFFQCAPSGEGETTVTVLAGVAELVSAIDLPRATEARDTAEAVLASRGDLDPDTVAAAKASLARAELRLLVASNSTR
jgi:F-type H+-transporting ATPase subunit epsilon